MRECTNELMDEGKPLWLFLPLTI